LAISEIAVGFGGIKDFIGEPDEEKSSFTAALESFFGIDDECTLLSFLSDDFLLNNAILSFTDNLVVSPSIIFEN